MRTIAHMTLFLLLSVVAGSAQDQPKGATKPDNLASPDFLHEHVLKPTAQNNYYVIARFNCVDNNDGTSRGSCDIQQSGASCAAAAQAVANRVAQSGDPCVHCVNVIDNTRHGNGSVQCIQGGPCQGQVCH